jgi:hypothetical protein
MQSIQQPLTIDISSRVSVLEDKVSTISTNIDKIESKMDNNYAVLHSRISDLRDDLREDFEKLKGIIGSTKAMPKSGDIDINNQGFTDEEYEELEVASKKNKGKKELSEKEKRLLKELEEKRKNRDSAVSILRGISIRMPLLIYGADVKDEDTQINVENFTDLIDEKSWGEFMPKGVTKKVFENFKKYYEPDVFRAAGKRIRAMARAADNLAVEERIYRITTIFSTFRNPDKETVLTPWRVVNMHLGDCLGGFVFFDDKMEIPLDKPRFVNYDKISESVFSENSKILEINSKSGLYPLYMTYGIYKNILKGKYPNEDSIPSIEEQLKVWDKVVAENIFVLCKTPMAKSITKRTLIGFREAIINTRYFEDLVNQISNKQQNFLDKVKQGKTYWKSNNNDNMKFNAIVGNPPYQQMDGGGTGDSSKPIYNKFIEIGKKISPNYLSMIFPSRWMKGGKGLDDFRNEMIHDMHIRRIVDFENAKECFDNMNIDGGICYLLWDKEYNGPVDYSFKTQNGEIINDVRFLKTSSSKKVTRDSRQLSIIEKFKNNNTDFKSIVSSRKPYGISTDLFNKPQKYGYEEIPSTPFENSVRIFGVFGNKGGAKRSVGYINNNMLNSNSSVNNYKLFHSYAYTTSATVPPEIIVGRPNDSCTETFLQIGDFTNEIEALNCLNYIKTKTFRALLSFNRIQKNISNATFELIPLQDFTAHSDIDWSKSIPEIDKQLYKKYLLTKEEIGFIESMIKPME